MELPYTNFEDALGYFYESELEFTDVPIACSLGLILEVDGLSPQSCWRIDYPIPVYIWIIHFQNI